MITLAAVWAGLFAYLSVMRNLAGGSHAEDLGFTDQVLWNSLSGHLFHMSIYDGAQAWNTEIDLSQVARPDSLLAFHFEPMLLGLLPIYAAGAINSLLILQAGAMAAGAIPAFRITRHLTRSSVCGLVIAATYLLSPLGQWAVLADFHTSTLAAPLLLLSLDRLLVARSTVQAMAIAAVALSAREDAALVVIVLGAVLLVAQRTRRAGALMSASGVAWLALAMWTIHAYSSGTTPFEVRYGPALADPVSALTRPAVGGYVATVLLSGGWLALFAPLALLPSLPSVALNVLSSSPWMASGQAHYSALVLPFVVLGAAFGLARLRRWTRVQLSAAVALACTSLFGYVLAGAGPLGANYAPATLSAHARATADLAASLPPAAAVSATSSLVPHVSQRSRVYVFPAVLDADYVFLDLRASPAPTSAGDVYLRIKKLLASGDYRIEHNADGLVLLAHGSEAVPSQPTGETVPSDAAGSGPKLIDAQLVRSPIGAIDVDGPRWILRTTWQATQKLPEGERPQFWITLSTGETLHRWDIADLWWNPPDQWPIDQPVTIDVPDIPERTFVSWSANWSPR